MSEKNGIELGGSGSVNPFEETTSRGLVQKFCTQLENWYRTKSKDQKDLEIFEKIILKNSKSKSEDDKKSEFEKMYDFRDIYSNDDVEEDMKKVIEREFLFIKKNELENVNKFDEKKGDDLEYLIDRCGELNNWFGENSFLNKTLKFDDYINGVDLVLEFDIGDEKKPYRVALTIDCTSTKDMGNDRLFQKIETNLSNMNFGARRVKYFESQVEAYRGEIMCIPVVIGVDPSHVEEMMDNLDTKKYLEDSPAQIAFLEEIKAQLDMYTVVLSRKVGDYSGVISEIEMIDKMIEEVLGEKKDLSESRDTKNFLKRDETFTGIINVVDIKKNPN